MRILDLIIYYVNLFLSCSCSEELLTDRCMIYSEQMRTKLYLLVSQLLKNHLKKKKKFNMLITVTTHARKNALSDT